jgi:hypothetical protein
MNSKPDPLKKTTRIPFRFVKGKFVHLGDGTEINELTEDCIGDILVETWKVTNADRVQEYDTEVEVDFLPKGTKLLARVNSTHVPDRLRERLSEEKAMIGDVTVEIMLEEDLRLVLRGTKPAKLVDCKCFIPALQGLIDKNKQPFSVNQAYARISEVFEPHRRSNTGNVFNVVHYYDAQLGWQPLRTLRDRCAMC